jgi:DNA-binding Xre family transcriptional regulator
MALRWKLRAYLETRHGIFRAADVSRLIQAATGYAITPEACAKLLDGEPRAFKVSTIQAICNTFYCRLNEILDCEPEMDNRPTLAVFKQKKIKGIKVEGESSETQLPNSSDLKLNGERSKSKESSRVSDLGSVFQEAWRNSGED